MNVNIPLGFHKNEFFGGHDDGFGVITKLDYFWGSFLYIFFSQGLCTELEYFFFEVAIFKIFLSMPDILFFFWRGV